VSSSSNEEWKNSYKKTIATTCPKGYTELIDSSVLTGPPGEDGAQGIPGIDGDDGELAVYGDGAEGNVVISTNTTPSGGLATNFNNLTISPEVTWTLSPGTTIRCTGTFTNQVTILTNPLGGGGNIYQVTPGTSVPVNFPASQGFAITPAFNSVLENNATLDNSDFNSDIWGPNGSLAINFNINGGTDAALLMRGNWFAAGAGGGAPSCSGGDGGGVVRILARGTITNSAGAVINADGGDGSGAGYGGGGGGMVILASTTSITNNGGILARGGNGGPAGSQVGHGGAGGGGSGGVAASGGFVKPDGSSYDGGNSQSEGVVVTKQIDPTAMFF